MTVTEGKRAVNDRRRAERRAWWRRHWAVVTAGVVVFVVVVAAFTVSFTVLSDLAAHSGIPGPAPAEGDSARGDSTGIGVAWMWPVIVDGTIVASILVLIAVRGQGGAVAWMPWLTLALFTLVSVGGNVLHAVMGTTPEADAVAETWRRIAVGAVPPVGLALSVHMLVIVIEAARRQATEQVTATTTVPAVTALPPAVTTAPVTVTPSTVAAQAVTATEPPVTPPVTATMTEPGAAVTEPTVTTPVTTPVTKTGPSATTDFDDRPTAGMTATVDPAAVTVMDDDSARSVVTRVARSATADPVHETEVTSEPSGTAPAAPARLHAVETLPDDVDAQVAWIAAEARAGRDVTARTIQQRFEEAGQPLSESTVARRIRKARANHPDAFEAAS